MKSIIPLPCLLLAIASLATAEEPNPFVKKAEEKPAEAPAGASFVGILEHILVPPDLIEQWLARHGVPKDATELRAQVQTWVRQGNAKLDHTAIGVGVEGRKVETSSILEQIYPTEYDTVGPGVWPLPVAFETRNLGYEIKLASTVAGGRTGVTADGEVFENMGSYSWHPLVERTRQPDDMFFPKIRSLRLAPGLSGRIGSDPFADRGEQPEPPQDSVMAPEGGGALLLLRADPLPAEREAGARSRLVFFRGECETAEAKPVQWPQIYHVSIKMLRVSHVAYSEWLQQQSILDIAKGSFAFAAELQDKGEAALVAAADGIGRSQVRWTFESISENIYPTEWSPANEKTVLERWEQPKDKWEKGAKKEGIGTFAKLEVSAIPGLAGASIPRAFETRNEGVTAELELQPDGDGVVAHISHRRVLQVGKSIFRRVEHNGEWIPDMELPLFTSSACDTTLRLAIGRWMLVSCGSEFTSSGKVDRENCLLTFIKVE